MRERIERGNKLKKEEEETTWTERREREGRKERRDKESRPGPSLQWSMMSTV